MSRRHHGRPHHGRPRPAGPRTATGTTASPGTANGSGVTPPAGPADGTPLVPPSPAEAHAPSGPMPAASGPMPAPSGLMAAAAGPTPAPSAPTPAPPSTPIAPPEPVIAGAAGGLQDGQRPRSTGPVNGAPSMHNGSQGSGGCTAPQLRRFIKSRPYVPMHELRRRFAIDGDDDDVTQVRLEAGAVYVGLPQREGSLLGELLRGGEIGYELSLDPRSPIVIGVYPMRPIPRS